MGTCETSIMQFLCQLFLTIKFFLQKAPLKLFGSLLNMPLHNKFRLI